MNEVIRNQIQPYPKRYNHSAHFMPIPAPNGPAFELFEFGAARPVAINVVDTNGKDFMRYWRCQECTFACEYEMDRCPVCAMRRGSARR